MSEYWEVPPTTGVTTGALLQGVQADWQSYVTKTSSFEAFSAKNQDVQAKKILDASSYMGCFTGIDGRTENRAGP